MNIAFRLQPILVPGLYMVHLKGSDGRVVARKVVIH